MKIRMALVFLVALIVVPMYAADEMRKLDWLVGDWKGEATVLGGPGKGEVALQTERVQSRQGSATRDTFWVSARTYPQVLEVLKGRAEPLGL